MADPSGQHSWDKAIGWYLANAEEGFPPKQVIFAYRLKNQNFTRVALVSLEGERIYKVKCHVKKNLFVLHLQPTDTKKEAIRSFLLARMSLPFGVSVSSFCFGTLLRQKSLLFVEMLAFWAPFLDLAFHVC